MMIRVFLVAVFFLISNQLFSQSAYKTERAEVNFEAGKSLEAIIAKNKLGKIVIREKDNAIAALINIKKFVFPNAKMQEHFNDNYLESDQYPKATFEGIIEKLDFDSIGMAPKDYTAKGVFTIHGVSQNVLVQVSISKNEDKTLSLMADFTIKLSDYKIKEPKLVFVKIAEEAKVKLYANLSLKKSIEVVKN